VEKSQATRQGWQSPRGAAKTAMMDGMANGHLERLTAVDASFLAQEGQESHMHVGALLVFDGEAPDYDELADQIRGRLHLVPRYRQKLVIPPLETGRPLWADDPSFNLEYHLRHTALPQPGTEDQLMRLAARIFSQQLDRSKPLWETWLVEGLEASASGERSDGERAARDRKGSARGRRFALISKTHHALVDGVAGVDLATVLFDLSPDPPAPDGDALDPWEPSREPGAADLVAAGLRGFVRTGLDLATRAVGAAVRPGTSLRMARDAAEGIGEIVWAGLNPAPETPLNIEIGPHRRYAVVRQRLADYKQVKDALGGTVNDVVLTVVSGALASWLGSRGVRTEGLEMRALVPVSIRTADQSGALGNRIAAMRGPLPVYVRDPVARLDVVKREMTGLKESKQALGAEVLASVESLAPPTILAQASRLNFSTRLFNLIVTNVPGPQFPLYLLGRRLHDLFPIAFLPTDHALAVAIMSYDGGIEYGLLADYDALPDVERIATGIDEALDELKAAAARASGAGEEAGEPAPTVAPRRPASERSGPGTAMRAKHRGAKPRGSGSRR
jgi:diacylglycerol O-acyltransferase